MLVAHAKYLRNKPAHYSHQHASDYGLEWKRFARKFQKAFTHAEQELGEGHGYQAAGDTEHSVNYKLPGIHELVLRNPKKRFIAKQEPQHAPRSGGGQHNRTQDGRMEIAHDFFKSK